MSPVCVIQTYLCLPKPRINEIMNTIIDPVFHTTQVVHVVQGPTSPDTVPTLSPTAIQANQQWKVSAQTRAPNKRGPDGRINVNGVYGEGVVGITVSPYNKRFRTQIEDGVWDTVNLLANKGYMPISSCEGHPAGRGGSGRYIIVATPSQEQAHALAAQLSSVLVRCIIHRSVANNNIVVNKYGHIDKVTRSANSDLYKEYKDIDYVFARNYTDYWYVEVKVMPDWLFFTFEASPVKHILYKCALMLETYRLNNRIRKLPESVL